MTPITASGGPTPPVSRVALCIPSGDQVAAGFAVDLAKLVRHTSMQAPDVETVLVNVKGSILPEMRSALVAAAMTAHATHLLWLDSDMRFPKDALIRLLSHEGSIVAANYPTRRPPCVPTVRDRTQGHLFTQPDSIGLVPVDSVGLGLCLVEMSVFHALPKPWFALGYNRQDDGYIGEDYYFCQQARAKGYQILVDHVLSKEVIHLGEMAWTHAHAEQTRQAYVDREGALTA